MKTQAHKVTVIDKDSQLDVGHVIFHGVGSKKKAHAYSQKVLETGDGQVECVITSTGVQMQPLRDLTSAKLERSHPRILDEDGMLDDKYTQL